MMIIRTIKAQDFNAKIGDQFQHNGHTYLVVNNEMIHYSDLFHLFELGKIRFCTSFVTDMSLLFCNLISFNQYIGDWDTSNVTNMDSLFGNAQSFNQDISNWDVSSVKNIDHLFTGAKSFNQDISNWDLSSVKNLEDHNTGFQWLFFGCPIQDEFKPKLKKDSTFHLFMRALSRKI